jgi:hypothetical protein
MSDKPTIDLELIALRAELREWSHELRGDVLLVEHPTTKVCHFRVGDVPRWGSGRRQNEDWVKALIEPRLTLDDIVADPGEGWTAKYDGERAEFYSEGIAVYFGGPQLPWASVDDADPITLVRRHRAVTDLLVKLAEVES